MWYPFLKNAIKMVNHNIGDVIDSHNEIPVYYNGSTDTNLGRNKSKNGYNYGLKYQCVEFVKRYYYDHLNHKMPITYGHAKDFFDNKIADGERNKDRDLTQYQNGSKSKPKVDDIIVFDATEFNPYGHVAIISHVLEDEIVIVQQNAGKFSNSRAIIPISQEDKLWKLGNSRILGWLRK
jgi:surface antigen